MARNGRGQREAHTAGICQVSDDEPVERNEAFELELLLDKRRLGVDEDVVEEEELAVLHVGARHLCELAFPHKLAPRENELQVLPQSDNRMYPERERKTERREGNRQN